MKVGKFYLTNTGEAFRCLQSDVVTKAATFEGSYVLEGPAANMAGLMQSTGMKEISELEYKRRVVAMRTFQDCKNDKDYPYKEGYLGQYKEMDFMDEATVESFFTMGGGFKNYELQ